MKLDQATAQAFAAAQLNTHNFTELKFSSETALNSLILELTSEFEDLNLDGEKIGLIAGENESLLGHKGIYFQEIFISENWKGKGLAKAIQRKFISEFTDGHEFVWGTIDSFNIPSHKTACSNRRQPIRYECFVNI